MGYYRRYYEALVAGLALDVLYGAPTTIFFGFQFVFTLLFAVLFVVMHYVKTKLRWYADPLA
jgi:hypothetical protein